ncbi:PAS domain S-box protein [Altererythrobacter luteolus]|uniref:Sensor protein FixL n=2 Tax=Pontixanthobacter luteolus TaxID=295089 RepID=A0A6I4V1U1_9SPHN|nr:PAS domain S-box protein [Pontixanthobacter luteolus]
MHALIDTVPDAMIVINSTGEIISFSQGAEKMFGYQEAELVGKNVSLLMPSPDREAHDGYLRHYITTGERRIIGTGRIISAIRHTGEVFPAKLSVGEMFVGEIRMFTGFIRDLSEQRETEQRIYSLQAELAHVSRITSLGTFASSLAHELNQPLTSVANYIDAAKDLLADPTTENIDMVRGALVECSTEAIRAGRIIHRLREFIVRGNARPEIASLSKIVREATALALVNGDGKGVDFSTRLDPACDTVLAVPVQIQQVLVNLLRNALEAMEDSEFKRIVIASEPSGLKKVTVSVSDSGPGLEPQVAERLFHPFISTKPTGMGLGLSICHTIVTAHGGRIGAEPSELGGTIFRFTLDRASVEESDE